MSESHPGHVCKWQKVIQTNTRTCGSHLGALQNPHLKVSWISDANQTLVSFLLTFHIVVKLKTNKNWILCWLSSSEIRSLILGWSFTLVQIRFSPNNVPQLRNGFYMNRSQWPGLELRYPAGYPDVPPMPQTKHVQSQADLPPQNLFFHLTPSICEWCHCCWVINLNCHSPLPLTNESFALIHPYIPVWTSLNPISHKSFTSKIPCVLPVQYPHPLAPLPSHTLYWEPLLKGENCNTDCIQSLLLSLLGVWSWAIFQAL